MKLKVNLGSLLDAVAQVAATLDRKDSASGRMYLRAKKNGSDFLYLYSTNLVAETLIKIPATVETEGSVLIDHSKITNGLNGLNRDLDVSLSASSDSEGKPTGLKIQASKTKFTTAATAQMESIGAKLKDLPGPDQKGTMVPATTLSEFIRRGMFCIGNDETGQNSNLTGLKILNGANGPEAMATDTAIAVRIHVDEKLEGLGSIVIPHQSLTALGTLVNRKKGENAEVIQHKNKLFFKFGDTIYGTLTLALAFPNLAPILDKNTGKYQFDVSRELLKSALSRAGAFIGFQRVVELELKKDELGIKAKGDSHDCDLADSVEITHANEKPTSSVRMAVGIDYLMNVATSTRSDTLRIGITKDDQPLVITDHDAIGEHQIDAKYVVMGVRLGK